MRARGNKKRRMGRSKPGDIVRGWPFLHNEAQRRLLTSAAPQPAGRL